MSNVWLSVSVHGLLEITENEPVGGAMHVYTAQVPRQFAEALEICIDEIVREAHLDYS